MFVSGFLTDPGLGEFFFFFFFSFRLCTCQKYNSKRYWSVRFCCAKHCFCCLEADFEGTRYLGSDRPTRIRNRDSGNRKQTFTSGWPIIQVYQQVVYLH